jgi:hypothetical protein
MLWVIGAVVVGAAGLGALGYFSLRVFGAVRALSRELKRAGVVLNEAAAPVIAGLDALGRDGAAGERRPS